jgi:hypothetical protein
MDRQRRRERPVYAKVHALNTFSQCRGRTRDRSHVARLGARFRDYPSALAQKTISPEALYSPPASKVCLLDETAMSHPSLPPSKPVDISLRNPSLGHGLSSATETSPSKPASNSPKAIVRRVVERTSDKLGRSKSAGSKSQLSPKPQGPSLRGSPKYVALQSRKGKERQTASTSDLGGSYYAYLCFVNS